MNAQPMSTSATAVPSTPATPAIPAPDWSGLGAGFNDLATGSQAVFRSVLQAWSHPGRCVPLHSDAHHPCPGQPTSAAVLLALLDAETRLWLSPTLAGSPAEHWLRFHTGCVVVPLASDADWIWAAHLGELPPLAELPTGSDVCPESAATCIVDVSTLSDSPTPSPTTWQLSGPGILTTATLTITDATAGPEALAQFAALRTANQALFPRGVDVMLATATHVVGLPRTTRIHAATTHNALKG
jgi:alpha-D-ribose 1-methylphosphonate 5-triphosphate synthase subunit PhnH